MSNPWLRTHLKSLLQLRSCQIHIHMCILIYSCCVWAAKYRLAITREKRVVKRWSGQIGPQKHRSLVIMYLPRIISISHQFWNQEHAVREAPRQQMAYATRGDNFNYTIRQIQLPSNHFRLFHYIPITICPPGHLNRNLYPSHALSLRNSPPECLFIARCLRIVIKLGFRIDIYFKFRCHQISS